MDERARSYREFWPRYLREHARPGTRALHFLGTGLGLVLLAAGIATLEPWLCAAGVLCGYLFAWLAHWVIERNRPATFTHPWWSLVSDLRMFALWLGGRLGRHLERCGLD
jgi:hypothetical protein